MIDNKAETEANVRPRDSESQQDEVVSEKKGTLGDQKDMHRMGKQQELRRNFRFVSIFGYSMVLMATWETILTFVLISGLCAVSDFQQDSNHPVDKWRHWGCHRHVPRHSGVHGLCHCFDG